MITCEICDNDTGSRIAIVEYDAVPQVGWFIEFGETTTPVKKVLLKPAVSEQNPIWTNKCSVVIFV